MIEVLRFVVIDPVGDGRVGKVRITLRRLLTEGCAPGGRLTLQAVPVSHNTTGTMMVLPHPETRVVFEALGPDVGQSETVVPPPDEVLDFAVVGVGVSAGKTYRIDFAYGGDGESLPVRYAAGVDRNMYCEAREEIYLALGLIERARSLAASAYTELTREGREQHRARATSLPHTPVDPLAQALDPRSLDWALKMIEVGTQVFLTRRAPAAAPPPGSESADVRARRGTGGTS